MHDLENRLSRWYASYVAAFSAYDAPGIQAHWAFPALIIHDGQRTSFNDPDKFTADTNMLLEFYKRQGVAKAELKLISCMAMTDEIAAMNVEDRMLSSTGETIVTWTAGYVLQQIDDSWRAVCAVADGETAAWKARGTPLGT